MRVVGDYSEEGYALIQEIFPCEVTSAFLAQLKDDLGPGAIPISGAAEFSNLLKRPAFEIYGHHYPSMLFFLWALTPVVSGIVGRELLPTYDYLRIYREGDVCRVHHDRPACEHSLSLTLDYSDGVPWNLEVERPTTRPSSAVEDGFGTNSFASLEMNIGDAVLYQGVNHRHGRLNPNPNQWSVHVFLHWVDRNGPNRGHAFDGRVPPSSVSFAFA